MARASVSYDSMEATDVERVLRRSGVLPLVRPTRAQVEVDFLPPYGDPEVHIAGEIATYLVVSAVAVELYERLGS